MKKQIFAMILAAAVAAWAMGGCSGGSESTAADISSITAKITAIDGNTVTAELGRIIGNGDMPEMPNGEKPSEENPPEMPNGDNPSEGNPPEMPNGEKTSEGNPPEMPNGEKTSEGNPPEMPNGENPSEGNPPEMPNGEKPSGDGAHGGGFEESGETITFELTENTVVKSESPRGTESGSIDKIAAGDIIEAELDGSGNAVSLTVRYPNGGGGFGGSGRASNGTAANTISESVSESGTVYTSDGDDENALRIDGAMAVLDKISVSKSGGDSSNTENGDFYGQNAALLAVNGANVTITNAEVNSSAVNGNGVFSCGEGTTVNISDSVIRTSRRNSGGIQTTGGAVTNAENLDIRTEGNSSAAIRSDRGGGTVTVNGGSYVTDGTGSPAIYCTADISVKSAKLTANSSEGVVVEGKNSVRLNGCELTGSMKNTYGSGSDENIHCIMIYQSMSGDADVGEAHFSAEGGSITSLAGDMFYVTNTDCTIDLRSVDFIPANDVFLRVEGNSSSRGWGTQGANGGNAVMTAAAQAIDGNILVDGISSLSLTLSEGSVFNGAVNPDGEGGEVNVTLEDSVWNLTADSHIASFDGDLSSVNANGFHLYVNGEQVI